MLLFDQNLSFKLCELLDDCYPGSQHVSHLGLGAADDLAIWEIAKANDFTIVSKDADFKGLSLTRGAPPKVVWLRSGNQSTARVAQTLRGSKKLLAFVEQRDIAWLEVE